VQGQIARGNRIDGKLDAAEDGSVGWMLYDCCGEERQTETDRQTDRQTEPERERGREGGRVRGLGKTTSHEAGFSPDGDGRLDKHSDLALVAVMASQCFFGIAIIFACRRRSAF
jgi:hypothetical protein